MEENVVGLEVSVHDVILIKNLEGLKELLKDQESALLIQNILLPQHSLESASIAILIDEIKIVLRLQHIKVSDDVTVFLDVC